VFHKPSLRTRVSFTVGMHELGGDAIDLGAAEISEHGARASRTSPTCCRGCATSIVVRTFAHKLVRDLAQHASIPVINALTDFSHPCQILSDSTRCGAAARSRHDARGVGRRRQQRAALVARGGDDLRLPLTFAVPDGFEPDAASTSRPRSRATGACAACATRARPCADADVVYTDTWTSMGQEEETAWRRVAFAGFQVNDALLATAKPDVKFLTACPRTAARK
jgi:ornithine carbamoyltransferase